MVIFGLNKERATDKRRVAEQITEIRQIIINKSHILGLWTEGDSDRKKNEPVTDNNRQPNSKRTKKCKYRKSKAAQIIHRGTFCVCYCTANVKHMKN